MTEQFRASIFKNGRSRAVRIPSAINLPGKSVKVWQEGDRVILEPVPEEEMSLAEWLATREPLAPEDRFPEIEDYPPEPVDFKW